MKKFLAFALSVVFVVTAIGVSYSGATNIYVPGNYPTIQEGINAAVNGDTVWVADGTYTGAGNKDLYFGGKAITVRSENGANACIINCEGSGRGFYFHSGEGLDSVLDGFTIRNGFISGDGGGIYCESSSPSIINCNISGNGAYSGGGICESSSSPSITNCTIIGNFAEGGGGICSFGSSTITNCTISDNYALWSGGGIYCSGNLSVITNCTISGNNSYVGAGIFSDGSSTITNCTISDNMSDDYLYGSAIYCDSYRHSPNTPSITNCILWNGSTYEIYVELESNPLVTYSNIRGGYTGEGNIGANPLFVDSANGDYHLQPGSPCIDAGITIPTVTDDIEGNPRPFGVGYDMGAYEYAEPSSDVVGSISLNGSPLPSRRVVVKQPDEVNQVAITDADGTYQVESVVSGKCFSVRIPGVVILMPKSTVSGFIKLKDIPLAGRKVGLWQPDQPDRFTTTDTEGFYQFTGLVPDKCFAVAIIGGYVPE